MRSSHTGLVGDVLVAECRAHENAWGRASYLCSATGVRCLTRRPSGARIGRSDRAVGLALTIQIVWSPPLRPRRRSRSSDMRGSPRAQRRSGGTIRASASRRALRRSGVPGQRRAPGNPRGGTIGACVDVRVGNVTVVAVAELGRPAYIVPYVGITPGTRNPVAELVAVDIESVPVV